jgi:Zn-finger nucleic acid-binding protein
MAEPKCPRCDLPLVEERHASRRYLACDQCAGCFAPLETIAHFRQDARALQRELPKAEVTPPVDYRGEVSAPERPAPCPVCAAPMTSHPRYFGGEATVDTCAEHGAWFDAQELARTIEALWERPTAEETEWARGTAIHRRKGGPKIVDQLLQRTFDRLLT